MRAAAAAAAEAATGAAALDLRVGEAAAAAAAELDCTSVQSQLPMPLCTRCCGVAATLRRAVSTPRLLLGTWAASALRTPTHLRPMGAQCAPRLGLQCRLLLLPGARGPPGRVGGQACWLADVRQKCSTASHDQLQAREKQVSAAAAAAAAISALSKQWRRWRGVSWKQVLNSRACSTA